MGKGRNRSTLVHIGTTWEGVMVTSSSGAASARLRDRVLSLQMLI